MEYAVIFGDACDVASAADAAGSNLEKRRSSSEGVSVGRSDESCEVACKSRDEGDANDDERDWTSNVFASCRCQTRDYIELTCIPFDGDREPLRGCGFGGGGLSGP